jgi:alpha-tubulin suppressor-like RCC1 family protein
VGISAGYAHTVLRDDAGRVFTMGQAANGQLGNGRDDEDAEWPVLAPELN